MAYYNLNWFEAKALAVQKGLKIRRTSWDSVAVGWLQYWRGLWYYRTGGVYVIVENSQFQADEFLAQDWSTAEWSANVCDTNTTQTQAEKDELAKLLAADLQGLKHWGSSQQLPPPPPMIPPL